VQQFKFVNLHICIRSIEMYKAKISANGIVTQFQLATNWHETA